MLFTLVVNTLGGIFKVHRNAQLSKGILSRFLFFLIGRFCEENGSSLGQKTNVKGPVKLFHGYKGIFISNKAILGSNVSIFQHVMIVSAWDKHQQKWRAPIIGNNVLIGAGAIIVGGVVIGDHAKIGAGTVVSFDVPPHATVVSQKSRIIDSK